MTTIGTLLAAAILGSSSGHAAAKKLYDEASVDFKVGSFERALAEFTEAYRHEAVPSFLFDMGQCERELRHWERAIFLFHSFLNDEPDAPNRPLVEKLIADAQAKLAAQARTRPKPAPSPAPAAAPTTVVLVQAPERAPAAKTAQEKPRPKAPVVAGAPAAAVTGTAPEKKSVSPAAWWLGGGAVAGLGAAAVLDGLAFTATGGDRTASAGSYILHTIPGARYQGAYNEAMAADVLWAVGGALAVAAGILILAR